MGCEQLVLTVVDFPLFDLSGVLTDNRTLPGSDAEAPIAGKPQARIGRVSFE